LGSRFFALVLRVLLEPALGAWPQREAFPLGKAISRILRGDKKPRVGVSSDLRGSPR
jgi:hypothetical protein